MGFDNKAFMAAKFEPSTEIVDVPELKEWFDEKDKPAWKIRGLTGKELGRVNEAVARNKKIDEAIQKIVSESPKKFGEGLAELLVGPDTPSDIARRIDMLIIGSIDPECNLQMALKVCEAFAETFFNLTNKIIILTGAGHTTGGRKPFGKKKT